jgi:NADH:ubiquinone oxidoreductase subunit 3 (subunit A)
LDSGTLAKGENHLTRAARYSVSKLTILIWDLITISWLFLWLKSWRLDFHSTISIEAILIHVLVVGYIYFFFKKGKVYQALDKTKYFKEPFVVEPYFTDSEKYVKNEMEE